jgi:hypothetical protein
MDDWVFLIGLHLILNKKRANPIPTQHSNIPVFQHSIKVPAIYCETVRIKPGWLRLVGFRMG